MKTQNNCLGIYIRHNAATVVCLDPGDKKVLNCFTVTGPEQGQPGQQTLANLIAQQCTERQLQFSDIALAVDCAMFMQHNVHSEFNDPKQIVATIKFDAEEALAADITDLALAFKVASTDQNGSNLIVFTARQKQLSDIILALQAGNIDPAVCEPDVNCLARFVLQNVSLPHGSNSLFCVFSASSGYFILLSKLRETLSMRTFLAGQAQNRTDLLARELPVNMVVSGAAEPVNCVKIFDPSGSVDCQRLGEKFGIDVSSVDLVEAAHADPQLLADCPDPVAFVIAHGAALTGLEKTQTVNFRSTDFMPYQGRKIRRQEALKFLSASVIVLVLAVGLYFQLQLLQKSRYASQLSKKFEKECLAVMFNKKMSLRPESVKKLEGELRRIRDAKSGLTAAGEESVSAKLTLVLDAFNKCAAQTALQIDSINVGAKTINISGDTSSRKNTLELFEALKKGRLDILQQRLDTRGARDSFSIAVVPKK